MIRPWYMFEQSIWYQVTYTLVTSISLFAVNRIAFSRKIFKYMFCSSLIYRIYSIGYVIYEALLCSPFTWTNKSIDLFISLSRNIHWTAPYMALTEADTNLLVLHRACTTKKNHWPSLNLVHLRYSTKLGKKCVKLVWNAEGIKNERSCIMEVRGMYGKAWIGDLARAIDKCWRHQGSNHS